MKITVQTRLLTGTVCSIPIDAKYVAGDFAVIDADITDLEPLKFAIVHIPSGLPVRDDKIIEPFWDWWQACHFADLLRERIPAGAIYEDKNSGYGWLVSQETHELILNLYQECIYEDEG